MSTARARKLKEQNQVLKLVKDLNKRMESFEDTVQELKILKDSITDMNDQLTEQEASNVETLRKLREDLKENKLRALNEAVQTMGKVIVSEEDLEDYKQEVQKWKEEASRVKASVQTEIKEKVSEQLEKQMKILELQNENRTSKLTSACDSYKTEVANLKETIARMSAELDSQKRLTADVAKGGRSSNQDSK
jgi:predicted TIM-barrel fold metal-dependent hydrolase